MINIKHIICTLFLILATISVAAQKQANLWYFGYRAGMDFNNTQTINGISSLPTFTSGPINTYEGCFSISDKTGNLLFSSDGSTIFNKNMVVMQNGTDLYGDLSSTNAGLAIPVPGSSHIYYVFTVPGREWSLNTPGHPRPGILPPGLCYSLVDMNENGGLGAVIEKNTNIPIQGDLNGTPISYDKKWTAENITATGHYNGKDYWIVTRIKRYFFSFLVTSQGVSEYAVVSDAGIDIDEINKRPGLDEYVAYGSRSIGYIKISPDGTRIAQCDYNSLNFTRGKFDNKTGIITDIKTSVFSDPLGYGLGPYGVEFSQDSKYVYIGSLRSNGICVEEVDVFNPVLYWATSLGGLSNFLVTTLQLASDGRIYGIGGADFTAIHPNDGSASRNLYVILNPNEGGTETAIIPNFFDATYKPNFGLPPFLTSYFAMQDIELSPTDVCQKMELTISVQVNSGSGVNQIDKLAWDFGDGSPIEYTTDMTVLIHVLKHTYSKQGSYTLTLTPYRANGSVLTDKIRVKVIEVGSCSIPVNYNITNMNY